MSATGLISKIVVLALAAEGFQRAANAALDIDSSWRDSQAQSVMENFRAAEERLEAALKAVKEVDTVNT